MSYLYQSSNIFFIFVALFPTSAAYASMLLLWCGLISTHPSWFLFEQTNVGIPSKNIFEIPASDHSSHSGDHTKPNTVYWFAWEVTPRAGVSPGRGGWQACWRVVVVIIITSCIYIMAKGATWQSIYTHLHMHETSCHWIWCRWYACLLDLKAHARVHQTLLHAFNPHWSLGVMDTRLRANATSSRVSIYRDAEQCAENVHSQIRKQQGSRLRCWHTTTEQQEVKNAPCLLHSTTFHFAVGYTCPGIYFRTEKDPCLSVCVHMHGSFCVS